MKNSPFYICKDFIAQIEGEEKLDSYQNVCVHFDSTKVVNMVLELTTHRLLFKCNSSDALLIKADTIHEVAIDVSKVPINYFVRINTQYGRVRLQMKSYNEARISIDNVVKKKAWLTKPPQKKQEGQMYSGMFQKINSEKQKIASQGQQVSQSFVSFDALFANLRDLKNIMAEIKNSTGQSDGDNPEVNKILKDMGFVSVIDREQAGKDFYRQLAKDLYSVCESTLFKTFGGVVALLDLYYFYNKKRQLNLLSPEQLLKACQMFPQLGFKAKVVHYPNNIVLVQSTTFDADADFQQNYSKYFQNYQEGITADEIARRKGLPVAIVEIKLRQACQAGKLAVADRIQGIKYYKNLLLTL